MANRMNTSTQVLSFLEGTWTGEGRGEYPTVRSFDYRETLSFTRHDEKCLAYDQRTYKRYDGQTDWLVSHWESGFLRTFESGELELICAQIGRSEILIGSIESSEPIIRIQFVSKTIANDPRMIASARTFQLEGDTLRYEVQMHTTKVEHLTLHLKTTLQRLK